MVLLSGSIYLQSSNYIFVNWPLWSKKKDWTCWEHLNQIFCNKALVPHEIHYRYRYLGGLPRCIVWRQIIGEFSWDHNPAAFWRQFFDSSIAPIGDVFPALCKGSRTGWNVLAFWLVQLGKGSWDPNVAVAFLDSRSNSIDDGKWYDVLFKSCFDFYQWFLKVEYHSK